MAYRVISNKKLGLTAIELPPIESTVSEGQYSTPTSQTCDGSCETCAGPTANDCLTCRNGYTFKRNYQGVCSTLTGYIQVIDALDNSIIGYVTHNLEEGYATTTTDTSLATLTSFNPTSSPFDIIADSSANEPFMGAVQETSEYGIDPLTLGSTSYAVITTTGPTAPGATPQRVSSVFGDAYQRNLSGESAIWTYNPNTNELLPQWVNSNNSTSPNFIILYGSSILLITGDVAAIQAAYDPNSPQVKFIFIQDSNKECTGTCVATTYIVAHYFPPCNKNFLRNQA